MPEICVYGAYGGFFAHMPAQVQREGQRGVEGQEKPVWASCGIYRSPAAMQAEVRDAQAKEKRKLMQLPLKCVIQG